MKNIYLKATLLSLLLLSSGSCREMDSVEAVSKLEMSLLRPDAAETDTASVVITNKSRETLQIPYIYIIDPDDGDTVRIPRMEFASRAEKVAGRIEPDWGAIMQCGTGFTPDTIVLSPEQAMHSAQLSSIPAKDTFYIKLTALSLGTPFELTYQVINGQAAMPGRIEVVETQIK